MKDKLDIFIDQFYTKYSPNDIPQGDRRARLRQKLSQDFDGYTIQMYTKYAPDNIPDSSRLANLRSKYYTQDPTLITQEQPQQVVAPQEQSVLEGVANFAGNFNKNATGALTGGLRGINTILSPITSLVDPNTKPEDLPLNKLANIIDENLLATGATYTDPTNKSWVQNDLAQGLGSAAGFALSLGSGAVGAAPEALNLTGQVLTKGQMLGKTLSTVGGKLASPTGLLGGAVGVNEAYQEAKAAGLPEEKAWAAGMQNFLGGATEVLPLERIFNRLNAATGNSLVNWLKQSASGGIEEGLQEALQKYWSNQVAKGNYDPDRDPFMDVLKDGGTAFVVGMILPFAANMSGIPEEIKDRIVRKLEGTNSTTPVNSVAPNQTDLQAISAEIDNDTQGLPDDVVKSIDDSVDDTARFINELDDLDLGNTSKVADDIEKATSIADKNAQEASRLKAEAAKIELEKIGANLNKLPVIPLSRLPEAPNKTLDAQNEVEEGGLYLKGFAPAEDISNKPVEEKPNGLSLKNKTVKGKKISTYSFNDEAGTAEGNIKGKFANIDTIYAAKDKEGNVKRGGKLYEKVITALENKGVKILTIGSQSDNSQKALAKLVEQGRLTIDPTGTITTGKSLFNPNGSTVNTKFTINPIKEHGNKTIIKESVKETPQDTDVNKVDKVKETKKAEKLEAIRVKLTNQLSNASKIGSKPSIRLKTFEKIAEKANELGLTELAQEADKLSQKEYESQQFKKEEKEERKNLNTKKELSKPKLSKEEYKEKQEQVKKEKLEAQAKKAINKPVKVSKGLVFNKEQVDLKLKDVKQKFYSKMAEFTEEVKAKSKRSYTEQDKENLKKVIEEYKKFRADNGLKEESDESIIKNYNTDYSKKEGLKNIIESGRQATRDKAKAAKMLAKQDFLKSIGENPEDFDLGLDENQSLSAFIQSGVKLTTHSTEVFSKDKIKSVSVQQLLGLLPSSFRNLALTKLLPVVEKSLKKQGKSLKIYIYDASIDGDFGFYATGKNHDILLVAKQSLNGGNNTTNKTLLHETLHGYFEVISSALLGTDEKFTRAVTRIYDVSKKTWLNSISNVVTNPLTASKQDIAIFNASLADIEENFGKNQANKFRRGIEAYSNLKTKEDKSIYLESYLIDISNANGGVYGFTSHKEMLAEIGSSIPFANLLNTIPYNTNYSNKKTFNSVLVELFNQLKSRFNDLIGKKDSDTAFSELEYVINNFSQEFEDSNDVEFEYDPYYDTPSIGDLIATGLTPKEAAIQQKMSALGVNMLKDNETNFNIDLKIAKKDLNVRKDILKNLIGTLSKIKDIKTYNDVKEYINRVNKRLPAEKQLGDVYALLVITKLNKERLLIEKAKENKVIRIEQAKLNPDYKTNYEFQTLVDDFNLVKIESLTKPERAIYNTALKDLVFNREMSPKAINIVINKGKKLHILDNLLPIANEVNKAYNQSKTDLIPLIGAKFGALVPALGNVGFENIANPALFSSIISRYKTIVGDKVYKYIYVNLSKAMAKANLESHEILTGIETIADKNNLSHSDFAKVAMYGRIFSTLSNPNDLLAWEKEVIENAENVLKSSETKVEAIKTNNYYGDLNLKLVEQELKIAQELLGNLKTKVDMSLLNKGQQELYDYIRNFYKKHESSVRRNAISVHGNEDYQERFNYFPSKASGKIDGDFKTDTLLNEGEDNLMSALGNETKRPYIGAVEDKAKKNRKNLEGYYYDFDALSLVQKNAKRLLFDLYTSMEFKTLNRLLQDDKFKNEKTGFGKELTNGFFHQLRNIAGSNRNFDASDRVSKGTKAAYKVSDSFLRTNIATVAQALYQASSGVAAAAVLSANLNPVTSIKNLAKAIKFANATLFQNSKESEFLRENALSIHSRSIDFERALQPDNYTTSSSRKINKVLSGIENFNIKPASEGDKWAAKVVWFASYLDAGGTLKIPNKEAVIRAERVAGMLQGMNDINFSAPIFKHNNQYKKIFFMMLYPYKSFALNAGVGLKTSAKQVFNSKEARQVAISQTAGLLAYRLTSGLAGTLVASAILGGLLGMGGDDDEDPKNYSWVTNVIANSLWDMSVGLDEPAFVDAVMRYLFNSTVAPTLFKNNDGEAFNQYVDSPIYSVSPKNKGDIFKSLGAPVLNDVSSILIDAATLGAEIELYNELDSSEEQINKVELDKKLLQLSILSTFYSGLEGVPLKGDLKKVIREYGKLEKQKLRSEND